MGTFTRALGRGLTEAGRQADKIGRILEDQSRYEEQLALKKERQEMDLRSANLRNEQLTLQNNLKKIELNTKNLTNLFVQSDGNPEILSPAISNIGQGYAEEYDKVASAAATKAAGKTMIVTHNGTYKTKENGKDLAIDPITGNKIFEQLEGPAGTTTRTQAEYNNHFAEVVNPNNYLARMTANQTQAQLRAAARIQQEEKQRAKDIEAKTPKGITAQKSRELDVKLKEKELARSPKGGSKETPIVTDISGNERKLTRQEYDGALAGMKIMAKDNPEWGVTSADQAFRINQLKNNPKLRSGIANTIKAALKSDELSQQFIEEGSLKLGVPAEMLRDMLDKAEAEQEVIESKKGGFVNWIKDFFGGTGAAPQRFNNPKQPQAGGLK